MSVFRVLATVAGALMVASPCFADEYTGWKKDEKKQTYTCEYKYTPKDPKVTEPYKQTVVVYYGDKDRQNWAYYYNMDNKPWARCALPGNLNYDPKAMYWEKMTPDDKGYKSFDMGKGYCPAPGDGKSAIKDLPLPPK